MSIQENAAVAGVDRLSVTAPTIVPVEGATHCLVGFGQLRFVLRFVLVFDVRREIESLLSLLSGTGELQRGAA